MEIVIKIPEDAYRQIRNWGVPTDELRRKIYDIIDNGTPLPKGHGRLIDADALTEKAPEIQEHLDVLATTIIEAEKCTYKETGCGSCKRQLDCPIEADKENTDEEN